MQLFKKNILFLLSIISICNQEILTSSSKQRKAPSQSATAEDPLDPWGELITKINSPGFHTQALGLINKNLQIDPTKSINHRDSNRNSVFTRILMECKDAELAVKLLITLINAQAYPDEIFFESLIREKFLKNEKYVEILDELLKKDFEFPKEQLEKFLNDTTLLEKFLNDTTLYFRAIDYLKRFQQKQVAKEARAKSLSPTPSSKSAQSSSPGISASEKLKQSASALELDSSGRFSASLREPAVLNEDEYAIKILKSTKGKLPNQPEEEKIVRKFITKIFPSQQQRVRLIKSPDQGGFIFGFQIIQFDMNHLTSVNCKIESETGTISFIGGHTKEAIENFLNKSTMIIDQDSIQIAFDETTGCHAFQFNTIFSSDPIIKTVFPDSWSDEDIINAIIKGIIIETTEEKTNQNKIIIQTNTKPSLKIRLILSNYNDSSAYVITAYPEMNIKTLNFKFNLEQTPTPYELNLFKQIQKKIPSQKRATATSPQAEASPKSTKQPSKKVHSTTDPEEYFNQFSSPIPFPKQSPTTRTPPKSSETLLSEIVSIEDLESLVPSQQKKPKQAKQ